MALTDADFACRFDVGDRYVWIECNRETCYSYLQPREGGAPTDGWLFNLVEAPEEFRPISGEPPILDRHHARAFDFDSEIDPEQFLVTGGEFEGTRAYEIWYADILIGVLAEERGKSRSAFATAPSRLVLPLDRSAALDRHFRRTEFHLRNVAVREREKIPGAALDTVEKMLEQAEFGLALDELEPYEATFSAASRAELDRVRLVRGQRAE